MYRCILTPVDGTAFGEHALPLAATIAARTGATLHLAHVHVDPITPSDVEAAAFPGYWDDILKNEEGDYLDALATGLESAFGIRPRHQIMDGSVPDALEAYARDSRIDLVVMSTHAHTGLSRIWHHCIADEMTEGLSLPVLLVRPVDEEARPDLTAHHDLRHVLVPLDGTGDPVALLEHARRTGFPFDARYTLLRVVRGGRASAVGTGLDPERIARRDLNELAAPMRAAGSEVAVEVRIGADPAEVILAFIRETAGSTNPVGMVAMESHPRRGLSHVLSARKTRRILRDAAIPVLVYQAPERPGDIAATEPLSIHK